MPPAGTRAESELKAAQMAMWDPTIGTKCGRMKRITLNVTAFRHSISGQRNCRLVSELASSNASEKI